MTHPSSTPPTPPADNASPAPEPPWPRWKRVGFRFLAVYFVLYVIPFPVSVIPWLGEKADAGVRWLWERAALAVGHGVLGIEGEIRLGFTGSGDTTVQYIRLLILVVLAVAGTLAWSLLHRRRSAYPRAARWLVVGCRFYLGVTLVGYGLAKVIPTQFTTPGLHRLLQPYGESSPMGIVWTFMGLSPAYTVFGGLMELIPGLLLFFRRTRLLGAALAVPVLTNVVALNFCYDVPVKLFSSHLLVMALALLLLDGRRLVALFLTHRPVPAADLPPLFTDRRHRVAAAVVATLIVGTVLVTGLKDGLEAYRLWGAGRERPAIWGIHDVETFRIDGQEVPPLLTDETRWRTLVVDRALPIRFQGFERPGSVWVQRMDGGFEFRSVLLDQEARTLTFLPPGHRTVEAAREAGEAVDVLHYERPEPGRLVLRGTFGEEEIEVELRERDLEEMLLISRGFHWINEVPFNR